MEQISVERKHNLPLTSERRLDIIRKLCLVLNNKKKKTRENQKLLFSSDIIY